MRYISNFKDATIEVFRNKNYYWIFFIASLVMLFIYVYIPILVTPGNDLAFFIEVTPLWGLITLVLLALFMGLLIAMQVFVFRQQKKLPKKETGTGFIAGISSITTGLFTSATCASCVSTLFAFLGTGTIFTLINNRWWIAAGGFGLVLISLFLTSRRINNNCKTCGIVLN